jgi:hypothetical protein
VQADTVVQAGARTPTPYLPLAVSYANPRVLDQWNRLQGAVQQSQGSTLGSLIVSDPQLLNRYAYARNGPLAYVDNSGEVAWWVVGGAVGGLAGFGAYAITHRENFDWREAALWTLGGTVTGVTLGAGAQWVAGTLGMEATVATGTAGTVVTTRGLNAFSRAAEFGVRSANELRKLTAGLGLQAHHLIEVRFGEPLGLAPGQIPGIALTEEEHRILTNLWLQQIGRVNMDRQVTTANATLQDVWEAAQRIYANYPELPEAVRQFLGISQ